MSLATARVSSSQRIKTSMLAEEEIMRFAKPLETTGAPPFALWHKHVHGAELDPMQVFKMHEMWTHRQTIDVSCRRTRKTSTKELYCLMKLATQPYQQQGIVAPRVQQSANSLKYQLDAIDRSPMMQAYISYKNGRKQKTDTAFELFNKSGAAAYGIMSQIDGDSLTIGDLDEVDDMPQDRLMSRFLPMLGAAQTLGADPKAVRHKPEIRITGVFKGADVLQSMINGGQYHLMKPVDAYLGLELGIISKEWFQLMQAEQTPDEWIRQFLCINRASRNFIWEQHIRKAVAMGLAAGIHIVEPVPGQKYRKRGLLGLGYDHLGHGVNPQGSRSALVIAEQIGAFVTFPFVRTWPADTDEAVIRRDLVGIWEYFNPDYAIGDAYGVGMLTTVNDDLYKRGLITVDRSTVGDGKSSAATWPEWAFAPMRFEGMVKHSMASAVRSRFHNGQAAIAYFDDKAEGIEREGLKDWIDFTRQLGNIKTVPSKAAYPVYDMANAKIGDDLFDAAMAAVWALETRGLADVPTVIDSRTVTRDQLLKSPASLQPDRLTKLQHLYIGLE